MDCKSLIASFIIFSIVTKIPLDDIILDDYNLSEKLKTNNATIIQFVFTKEDSILISKSIY